MNHAQRSAKKSRDIRFLFVVVSCLTLIGCEDPGIVGGGFTDTDTSIRVDTIEVEEFGSHTSDHFSGRLTYFSAGQFSDPVFGDMKATGLIKPALSASSNDTMEANAAMKLRLFIDQGSVYGDSAATAEFDLIELDQVWRGKAWNIGNQVTLSENPPVGSFTVQQEDSIDVSLSDTWIQKYRSFFENESADRDSLYRIQFPGLAVVPRNTSKIIPVNVDSSSFIIENPNEDTLKVAADDWAYSLERTNQPAIAAGLYPFHSTLEQFVSFDVGLTREDLGTVNISRVELVLYEDTDLLTSSMNQISATTSRPEINSVRLHLVEPAHVPENLFPGLPILGGTYNPDDGSFRFNLTGFVNGVLLDGVNPELKFYITLENNNGIVRSSLIHNLEASAGKEPKLIVTSVEIDEG